MDWSIVLSAAVSGVLGAGIGAVLGVTATRLSLSPIGRHFVVAAFVLAGAGALVLASLAPTATVEQIAPGEESASQDPAADRAAERLARDALFVALIEENPNIRGELDARVRADLARAAGRDTAGVLADIRMRYSVNYGPRYLGRGRDADLVGVIRATNDIARLLASEHPMMCHDFLFGAATGRSPDPARFAATVPLRERAAMANAFRDVVVNAHPAGGAPAPTAAVTAATQRVYQGLVDDVGADGMRYLIGEAPPDDERARAACLGAVGFHEAILAEGDIAGAIYRGLIAPR